MDNSARDMAPSTPKRNGDSAAARTPAADLESLRSPPVLIPTNTPSIRLDSIPALQFDEVSMDVPQPSPAFKRDSFSSRNSPQNLYRHSNGSAGSLGSKRTSTSLNYVPSFAAPPPPSSTSHSHSNSQSSVRRARSPIRSKSPIRSPSPIRGINTSPIRGNNPFNYKPTSFSMMHGNGSQGSLGVPMGAQPNKRRGHRYKHSSVSMNLFQEPVKRAPLNVPQSFSIPNGREVLVSLTFMQKVKATWCVLHVALIVFMFVTGLRFNNAPLLTLSHLCFYDVLSNVIVVIVDVMANFECWNNASLQYPFGLGRIEVLVGFGLSVSLIFVGGDLVSHFLEELIINLIIDDSDSSAQSENRVHHSHSHDPSQHAAHEHLSPFQFELLIILVFIVTVISSNLLLPSRGKTVALFNRNYLINSSTNLLTLAYASYALVYPLISDFVYFESLNDLATLAIAFLICTMAWKLIKSLSNILLIAYPYDAKFHTRTVAKLTSAVHDLDIFKSSYKIDKIVLSKVNYKIYIVIVRLQMTGCTDEDESRMRFYVSRLIQDVVLREEKALMGEDAGEEFASEDTPPRTSAKFEITIDINRT